MSIKRVLFIRSGETDWNKTGRWQGWAGSPLNEHGRLQVAALANFLRNIGLKELYSSDLRRARDTAEVIAERVGIQPIYDERLRERKVGILQGMTIDEIMAWYPDVYQALMADPEGYHIPEGESLGDVYQRMSAAFEAITRASQADTLAIVTHTVSLRRLLAGILGQYDDGGFAGNSSVTTLAQEGDGWRLVAANDVMHLEGLESRISRELGGK